MSKPPRHAYEVTVTIGGNTWEYVTDALAELARHVKEHGDNCGMASGGWDGCHSVDILKRDISPDDYRKELETWSQSERSEKGEGR